MGRLHFLTAQRLHYPITAVLHYWLYHKELALKNHTHDLCKLWLKIFKQDYQSWFTIYSGNDL